MSESNSLSRRDFVKTAGAAAAASLVLNASALASVSAQRRRYAIVGTGDRATRMWGSQLIQNYSDVLEVVGLCDINPKRVAVAREMMEVQCPTFTNFEQMCDQTKPDLLMVTTVDRKSTRLNSSHLVISYAVFC